MTIGDLIDIMDQITSYKADIVRLESEPMIQSATPSAKEKRKLLAVRKQAVAALRGIHIR